MSESTRWVIVAFLGAVVLSLVWMRWRAQSKEVRLTPAEQTDRPASGSPAGFGPTLRELLRRQPLLIALLALGLAGVAQYALLQEQTRLALIGYGVAGVLFAAALYSDVPQDYVERAVPAAPAAPPAEVVLRPQPAPAQNGPALSFRTHWRYYTIADLLKGRTPILPPSAVTVMETAVAPAVVTAAAPRLPAIEPAPPGPALRPASPGLSAAQVAIWTGDSTPFVKPHSLLVTQQGHLIVLDQGQNVIYQLDPSGSVRARWSVPSLPEMHTHAMALSPDGRILYIADPQQGCIHVINLGVHSE
jgi:hypothetical protein